MNEIVNEIDMGKCLGKFFVRYPSSSRCLIFSVFKYEDVKLPVKCIWCGSECDRGEQGIHFEIIDDKYIIFKQKSEFFEDIVKNYVEVKQVDFKNYKVFDDLFLIYNLGFGYFSFSTSPEKVIVIRRQRRKILVAKEWDYMWGNGYKRYIIECSKCHRRFGASGWNAKETVEQEFEEHKKYCKYIERY